MPSTLESCENLFGSKDLYGIFEIDKKASVAEIKKAYYKKALKVHPDRVTDEEKEEATEKFKILAKIHEVLSDDSKRALYDEQGIVDDDDTDKISTWLEAFKHLFKPISESDINNYHKEYVGSELERSDLKKAYINGKGCINYLFEHVPFMTVEDEPRFHVIISEWVKDKEVPEFAAFFKEPKSKRDRRHKKYSREAKEAEKIKAKLSQEQNDENDLAKQIMQRNQDREKGFNSFIDKLAAKYGNEVDEEDELYEVGAKKIQRKNSKKAGPSEKSKKKETPIKTGRVSKSKK